MTILEKAIELVDFYNNTHLSLGFTSNFTNIPVEFRITIKDLNESSKIVKVADLKECEKIIQIFISKLNGKAFEYSIVDNRLSKEKEGFLYLHFLI